MSSDEVTEMLNSIGQHIADIIGEPLDNGYLNAEAGENWAEVGIFQDLGPQLAYRRASRELFVKVMSLWDAAETSKKWAGLHYDIKDGRFDARFEYSDAWNPEETATDRLARALQERFGDKPVIYPPPDDSFHELAGDDLSAD